MNSRFVETRPSIQDATNSALYGNGVANHVRTVIVDDTKIFRTEFLGSFPSSILGVWILNEQVFLMGEKYVKTCKYDEKGIES